MLLDFGVFTFLLKMEPLPTQINEDLALFLLSLIKKQHNGLMKHLVCTAQKILQSP